MKKLALAFLLMMTFAATGVCDMNYELQNPHITYEKTDSGMPELIDTLTENEPEDPTFIVDEVDSDTAQASFPKTFTITVGGDTTLGSTDVAARILAERMGQTLGQTVVVENRSGSGGNVGADAIAKSAPDGYTVGLGGIASHAIAPTLYASLPFNGASLVVLPEKWSVYGTPDDQRAGAEPRDGPALAWARATACELGIDLVAGSIAERPAPDTPSADGRGANTSVHVGPDGTDRATYRKLHMFDVLVGGRDYRESDGEAPGSEIVLSATADGTGLGLTICYDLRFPELYRRLAVDGARILAVPSAFTEPTTRDHWEVLLRARAIENQAFVIAANQVGRHAPGLRTGGRSMIVDPWGIVLAQAADAECHVIADLDLGRLERIRADLPSLANRRPEVYG